MSFWKTMNKPNATFTSCNKKTYTLCYLEVIKRKSKGVGEYTAKPFLGPYIYEHTVNKFILNATKFFFFFFFSLDRLSLMAGLAFIPFNIKC